MIKNKYLFIFPDNKFKILSKGDHLKEQKDKVKNIIKKNTEKYKEKTIILLRLKKINQKNNTNKIKLHLGPIRVEYIYYKVSKRGSLKKDNLDRRSGLLFYSDEYLKKNKVKMIDLRRIAKASYLKKLEKGLLAPKYIEQIDKKNIEI